MIIRQYPLVNAFVFASDYSKILKEYALLVHFVQYFPSKKYGCLYECERSVYLYIWLYDQIAEYSV